MPDRGQLPFDPIEEARRHRLERWPGAAAPSMVAAAVLAEITAAGRQASESATEVLNAAAFGTDPLADGELDDHFATLRTLRVGAGDFAQ